MTAADRNRDAADPVERLLSEVVDLPADEQDDALSALCARHPDLAARLRERFARYRRLLRVLPEEPPQAGRRFGEFELMRELGRGGMGVVYLARQRRAGQDRLVALKLLRDRGPLTDRARERLRREAAAAFRLDDPGLCPVFDAGECDGVPWLAMRYVAGRTLAAYLADARRDGALALPAAEPRRGDDSQSSTATATTAQLRHAPVLAIGEALARSLHVAHEAGFVHRDVKPGNVMITPEGLPVLLDFGLVREDGGEQTLTATGEALGTPAYMAPEQIDGRARVDRTVDVYSLAATLWEAIALERPFAGRTREELFAAILRGELRDLRKLAPGVSRDLALVLATAMAREPERRYATALDFALELRRVRRSEPILTRPPGPARRVALWSRRNPLAAALLSALAVSLVVVLFVAADAREAEARAVHTLASARAVVAELVRVQNDELDDVPGLEGLRRDMQERAVAFLREFRGISAGDPGLAVDHVESLLLAATLEQALGHEDDAGRLHAEAGSVLATLRDDPKVRELRGRHHLFDGERKRVRGDVPGAMAAFERATVELRGAGTEPARGQAMVALTRLCVMRERANDVDGALAAAGAAIALHQEHAQRSTALEYGNLLTQRARLLREANRKEEASREFALAADVLRDLFAAEPDDRHVKSRLAMCLDSWRVLARQLGDEAGRRALLAEEIALLGELAAAFPSVSNYRSRLAGALTARASVLAADGRRDDAVAELERARSLLDVLVGESPENASYRERLAALLFNLGNRLRRDRARAERCWLDGLAHVDHLLAAHGDDWRWCMLGARTAMNLAIGYALDDDPRAPATFARARARTDQVLRLRPDDLSSCQLRGLLLFNEGAFRVEHGEIDAGTPLLGQAFEQAVETLALTPGNARRAAEVVRWGVRWAQVCGLRDGADADAAWAAVERRFTALPDDLRRTLREDDAARLDVLMLWRARAASAARDGVPDGVERLEGVVADLALLQHDDPSAAGRAEYLLALVDAVVLGRGATDAAAAAGYRSAARAALEAWPAEEPCNEVTRLRLLRRRADCEALLGDRAEAEAAFARLLAAH